MSNEICSKLKDEIEKVDRCSYKYLLPGDNMTVIMKETAGGSVFDCQFVSYDDRTGAITVARNESQISIIPIRNIGRLDVSIRDSEITNWGVFHGN